MAQVEAQLPDGATGMHPIQPKFDFVDATDNDVKETSVGHEHSLKQQQQKQQEQQEEQQQQSKSQMKKLAKRQRILERRPEKRKLEKERRRLKKLELASLDQEHGEPKSQINVSKPRPKLMSESSNKFKVVIDMDFEDFMADDEIAKAAKQVNRAYSANRHSENPCQLYISSLKGKIRDRFAITSTGYLNWDANMSPDDYLDLFVPENLDKTAKQEARDRMKQDIIYLTGDTDELLPDVDELLKDESKIFVIGGLVDHNRHKNLCYQRAQERQIKTAKLPIKENLKLCQRHILSTVTVFEIMLNVLGSHKTWREALIESIPRRKIHESEFHNETQSALVETTTTT